MTIGNMLASNEARYVAVQDETKVWRILDTWHADIKNLNADSDIPDESPAVNIITDGEAVALIKGAAAQGMLENATFGAGESELEADILDRDAEIQQLKSKILNIEEDKSQVIRNSSHTEDYQLKEKAMENILKLVSMQDMSNLSKE